MALKARIRCWLDAASQTALTALRGEVERLAGEVVRLAGEGAQRTDEGARLAGEVAALRSFGEDRDAQRQRESDALRDDLAALAAHVDAITDRNYATTEDLAELLRGIESKDATVEEVRIALAGLTAQLRWESEDLRKGLAAIIERVERQRKPA